MVGELSTNNIQASEKMGRAILALVNNRQRILSKGYSEHATLIMGENMIQIGLTEAIIGDTKFKLPKPKKEK